MLRRPAASSTFVSLLATPHVAMHSSLRPVLVVALIAAAGFAGVSLWNAQQDDAPLPEGPKQVLPASEFVNAEASLEYYREALRRNPEDIESRVALAQVLLQQARATGRESEYVPLAEAALAEALRQDPEHYHALLLQASLLNTLHRFEDARDLAERLIARYPEHAFPYGLLTDALVELGEYDAAVSASDSMNAIKPSIASYARASYLRELHGDTGGAIEAMRLAVDAGAYGQADRAWAVYQLAGLYLADAKPDTAAFLFNGLLEERPDYARAVAGLGHVALVKGETDEAIRRLETAYGMAPLDVAQELLAEAWAVKGDERKAAAALRKVRQGLADARDMGEIVEMEEADLMLDHDIEVERALGMAQRQVERRPGHLHANETYAWALHHNGRSAEAIPYIERAMRLGTGDAMVHFRAGLIYDGAGDRAEAVRHLRLALDNHLRMESPTAEAEARATLDRLGGAASA